MCSRPPFCPDSPHPSCHNPHSSSPAFFSFYALILLAFVGLAIASFYALKGRDTGVEDHLLMQARIYARDLLQAGKSCLKRYGLEPCRTWSLELGGYAMHFGIGACMGSVCVVDVVVQRISPLSTLPFSHTQRVLWDLRSLEDQKTNQAPAPKKWMGSRLEKLAW